MSPPKPADKAGMRLWSDVAVEALEQRSLCAAVGLDSNFAAELPPVLASMRGYASGGAVLADGRFLAVGEAYDGNKPRNVYVLYNADGTLATTFGPGGFAIQTVARTAKLSLVGDVYALGDGSAMIQFADGLRRLTPAGQFDPAFGTDGVLDAQLTEANPQTDGTTLAVQKLSSGSRLVRFDLHGQVLRVGKTNVFGTLLASGERANFTSEKVGADFINSVTIYNSDQTVKTSFGNNGTLALSPLCNAWLAKRGPWYNKWGEALDSLPFLFFNNVTSARDGGYVIDANVLATRTQPPADSTAEVQTRLRMHLSADGTLISLNTNSDDRATATFFAASTPSFGGVFHFGEGTDTTFTLADVDGSVITSVLDPNGGYYLLGTSTADSSVQHFTVVRTNAPSGTIAGTLFNDHNRDGIYESAETVNANRTVFLDTNNNGHLDPDEPNTTTDAAGHYFFTDVGSGSYVVRRVLPPGYVLTTTPQTINVAPGSTAIVDIGSANPV